MKQTVLVRVLDALSHSIMRLVVRVLAGRASHWAQAMMAEFDFMANEREAFAFASGCLRAALMHALRDAGVEEGDTVIIGDHELEWTD